jgi:DNA-directed RNA polymerase subunit E'/Rpb7
MSVETSISSDIDSNKLVNEIFDNNQNQKIIIKLKKNKKQDISISTNNKSLKNERINISSIIENKINLTINKNDKNETSTINNFKNIKNNKLYDLICKNETHIDVYSKKVIQKKITVPISKINGNIKNIIENMISLDVEGKCIADGFIKPNSVKLLSYSCGLILSSNVSFEVNFECMVCSPSEGIKIYAKIKNITKAGIKAEIDDNPSPLVIFISKSTNDNYNMLFNDLKVNDSIKVKIIGKRYELNDKYISVIGQL